MRCACTWPSSCGGVSQLTVTVIPFFAESSFAAESAPVRAARNTGFVELFAIIAIVILSLGLPGAPAAGAFAAAAVLSGFFSLLVQATRANVATATRIQLGCFVISRL